MTELGPGREFDLIRAVLDQHERRRAVGARAIDRARTVPRGESALPAILLGAGDDAAVVDATPLVISADLSFEDVHFRRDWITAREIGWRATAAALSDLAAMAATPMAILVSFAATSKDADFALEVMGGASDASVAFGAALIGGDVSRSTGPFVIDVIVLGQTPKPVARSGAVAGDSLWVTGSLGGAAAAVAAWMSGQEPDPAARLRFARPQPRIDEALWLAGTGLLHAMIDLSDGLAGDARHLAAASNAGIRLDLGRIPIDPASGTSAPLSQGESSRVSGPLRLALGGGEDYELCFAAAAQFGEREAAAFRERFGVPLTRVGSVVTGAGVVSVDERGEVHALELAGYTHL